MRTISDTILDAIITISANGIVRFFNRGAECTLGYTAEEAIGEPLALPMPERYRGPHAAGCTVISIQKSIGKGVVEFVRLRKDGEEFSLEFSLGDLATVIGAPEGNKEEEEAPLGTLFEWLLYDI
jgi:PAS domain S-box-containing protein